MRALLLGGVLLGAVVGVAALAPWIAPYGYDDQSLAARLTPPVWVSGGSWQHLLGTDQLGRDMLTRIIYGARPSLVVGLGGVGLGGMLGVGLGLLTGYHRGWVDVLIMRVADAQLAFPYLLLAIAIVTVVGPSFAVLVAVLGLRTWVIYARTVRGSTLSIREHEYVQAAEALGASSARIIARHVLPNVMTPAVVLASVELAQLVLLESTLGFLGLGVQPPMPSWGSMLSGGRNYLQSAWWVAVFPGLAIMVTVLGANLLGEGLREALDPRT